MSIPNQAQRTAEQVARELGRGENEHGTSRLAQAMSEAGGKASKHTPGPWIMANGLQIWHDGENTIHSPRICTIQNAADPVRQLAALEMNANARLIAAAPDLLDALRESRKHLHELDRLTRAIDLGCHPGARNLVAAMTSVVRLAMVRDIESEAAIAKATGGAA